MSEAKNYEESQNPPGTERVGARSVLLPCLIASFVAFTVGIALSAYLSVSYLSSIDKTVNDSVINKDDTDDISKNEFQEVNATRSDIVWSTGESGVDEIQLRIRKDGKKPFSDSSEPLRDPVKTELLSIDKPAPDGEYSIVIGDSRVKVEASSLLAEGYYYKNKDDQLIYRTHTIPCTEYEGKKEEWLTELSNQKTNNLRVYSGDMRYATDGANVYFNRNITGCMDDSKSSFKISVLPSADPATFVPNIASLFPIMQGNDYQTLYSSDGRHVYYEDKLLEGVDAPSFQIASQWLTADKNHVYLRNVVLDGANRETYAIIFEEHLSPTISKSNGKVYFDRCIADGVDADSFGILDMYFRKIISSKDIYFDKYGVFGIDFDNCRITRR